MITPDIVLRSGDRLPYVQRVVKVDDTVVDLTDCTEAKFHLVKADTGTVAVDATATIVTPKTAGTVRYTWSGTDDDHLVAGWYFAYFELTIGSSTMTVPNEGPLICLVTGTALSGWSYSGDPAARPIDAVRFTIGDTNANDPMLSDSEILYLLDENGTPSAAATDAADKLASRYTSAVQSKTVGDLTIAYGDRARAFAELAARLKSDAVTKGAPAAPWAHPDNLVDTDSRTETDHKTDAYLGQFDNVRWS